MLIHEETTFIPNSKRPFNIFTTTPEESIVQRVSKKKGSLGAEVCTANVHISRIVLLWNQTRGGAIRSTHQRMIPKHPITISWSIVCKDLIHCYLPVITYLIVSSQPVWIKPNIVVKKTQVFVASMYCANIFLFSYSSFLQKELKRVSNCVRLTLYAKVKCLV